MTKVAQYQTVLPGGKHWSLILRRGQALRMMDVDGGANVGMLFYNPLNLLERYNAPDTLKCQHTVFLTTGVCLYSDMGRIFASVTADDLGWHDTIGGTCNKELVASRWGANTYQDARNEWRQNGQDSFLVEGAKYGLGRRDLAANVNWFSKVSVADDGAMRFHAHHARAGAGVTLRFEMDTLVLLHTCPHPMNTATPYPARAVELAISDAPRMTDADPCLNRCDENQRGFANNAIFHQCGMPQGAAHA